MARRKKRFSFVRLLFVMLLIVMLALALAFGISKVFNLNDISKTTENQNTNDNIIPVDDKKENDLIIEINNYEVYENNELDYNFIILTLDFKKDKINVDLVDLKTNEDIYFSKVSGYIKNLTNSGYSLNKYNFTEVIKGNDLFTGTFFVPYTTDDTALKIIYGDDVLTIDLTKNGVDINTLKNEDSTIVVKNDYELSITKAEKIDYIFKNGEYDEQPSSVKIYNFTVKVNKIVKDITLVKAEFVSKDNQRYEALGNEYTYEQYRSMFDGTLKEGESYDLFFKVLSSDSEPLVYEGGNLELIFSNSNDVIKVSADLN